MATDETCDFINGLPTELMVSVLTKIPMKDLLLSQRVCKGWRELISKNEDLQRALFLLPEPAAECWKFTSKGVPGTLAQGQQGVQGFVREETFECLSIKPTERTVLIDIPGSSILDSVIKPDTASPFENKIFVGKVNPLFFEVKQPRWMDDVMRRGGYITANYTISDFPSETYPNASWKRMYICQPPIANLFHSRFFERSHFELNSRIGSDDVRHFWDRTRFYKEGGVMMGDLVGDIRAKTQAAKDDVLDRFRAQCRDRNFSAAMTNLVMPQNVDAQFFWEISYLQLEGMVSPNEDSVDHLLHVSGTITDLG